MNSFEYESTDTEQVQAEQTESETILHESPVVPTPKVTPEEAGPIPSQGSSESSDLGMGPQPAYELSFSCLLIPRFADHYLTGDITDDLAKWMKEICISYGWRLNGVMIRPGYFQWVMTVPLTTNPAHFMRLIRQQTSQKILDDYPRYKRQNLSGDFWAPGFSVAPGNQHQSLEDVNNFILQTRRHQGIY